mgnify:CR=1 FL=1
MLRPDELIRRLDQGLAPVYLVAGDEPLFVQETLDAVRAAARKQGFTEREVLEAESGFDWNKLAEAAGNLSLFGDRRLIELRLPSGKPGQAGSKAIAAYCKAPPPDVVLLISCNALDAKQRRASWVTAAERAGQACYAWPLRLNELPGWVANRLRRQGLQVAPEGAALLAARAEGNLLAAAQEVDKLALLYPNARLSLEQVEAAVADSARYSVYDLADAALDGSVPRALRILRGLREEGVEAVPVVWVLASQLRVLAELAAKRPPQTVFRDHNVFKMRQQRLMQAARRAPAQAWESLLSLAAVADREAKGVGEGRPWDTLARLAAGFAGAGKR